MIAPLAAAVADRAVLAPDEPAFTALSFPGGECRAATLTTAELHSATGDLAAGIREHTEPGDRVAILCRHGIDYAIAFLACLYTARTAVPLFPVTMPRHADRLHAILADARPSLGLISADAEFRHLEQLPAPTRFLTVDPHARSENSVLDRIADRPAYLQYTSGSTTSPAGVEISHTNLRAALDQLRTALPVTENRPLVNWLPYFHDMGLVFALSLPLYTGVHTVTLPPGEFAKRPIRWLRACADYGAGATASPNFGLTLTVSATTPAEREGLDLSGLELLLNGAEPIRYTALDSFTRTFAPYGFRHAAHTPGYGLAEATLPVTVSAPDAPPVGLEFDRAALGDGRAVVAPSGGTALVDCGRPMGQTVRIADPETLAPLADDAVGEIWVQGPNVAGGYAGRPDRTECSFGAAPEGESGSWLRTGDLGFVHRGGLFIAGRLRDIIVVDGRNHFPADIEATAADIAPELRTGHIAAFGVDDGESEQLILVAEIGHRPADPDEVARRIRIAVTTAHGIAPTQVLMVPRGAIPKTSSGKVRRNACRDRYRAGEFTTGNDSFGIPAE
ncbi:putative long-chain-fatty-acid--AMP ligase [Nocardia nova SH22a]|uniref:Putative long-chain-fatty-acid--AMP ligase n=2 Tax=Nocardia nova TaxID=37330 RepID=W5TTQ7_9NOCA|nr:fatty acyl-AMP ligase [Nocardia nova]AGB51440.1 putative long-chain fatty acyl-AMP ligase [Nocardia nova]AHH22308.1 putative long-chain-fatty-acid--AMP ligase [Nocardia nova SH22a]